MKLVFTTEDTYAANSSYLGFTPQNILNITSPRITQISRDAANNGGVLQRGDAFKSIYVEDPIIVISIKVTEAGVEDKNYLNELQVSSSITSFDTYTSSGANANGPAVSTDDYNMDSQLFATLGRIYFDLEKYATSQVVLKILNRSTSQNQREVRVRTEIFSKTNVGDATIALKRLSLIHI